MLKNLRNRLLALHRDEGGADMVEYILLIAIIALPLLGVLIWFWKDISSWVNEQWENVKGGQGTDPSSL